MRKLAPKPSIQNNTSESPLELRLRLRSKTNTSKTSSQLTTLAENSKSKTILSNNTNNTINSEKIKSKVSTKVTKSKDKKTQQSLTVAKSKKVPSVVEPKTSRPLPNNTNGSKNSERLKPKVTAKATKLKDTKPQQSLMMAKSRKNPNAANTKNSDMNSALNDITSIILNKEMITPNNKPKSQDALVCSVQSQNNIRILDLDNDKPKCSHDITGESRTYSHEEWCVMKEGLLNKILEQEIELNELREKVSSYEAILQLLDKERNDLAGVTCILNKPPPLVPRLPKTVLGRHTCYLIGDSHVRGLAPELSSVLPSSYRTEAVFLPGVGFDGLAKQHVDSPNLVTPSHNDIAVMMCGTNDVCCTDWVTIQKALDTLIKKFENCKMFCVVGIPYRHDTKKLNFHIKRFNAKLKGYIQSKMTNFRFLDPISLMKPKDYRVDGLHFNKIGKSKLCRKISVKILDKSLGLNQVNNEELTTKVLQPTSSYCENWLLSEPIREELPVENNASVICENLIDLSDPPQPDEKHDEQSYFSNVMNKTVLFPDNSINNYNSNFESLCQTYSTPYVPTSNNYYKLTHVSVNSFDHTNYNSPLSTMNQTNLGFLKMGQTNQLI